MDDQTIGLIAAALISNFATYLITSRKSSDEAALAERASNQADRAAVRDAHALILAQSYAELTRMTDDRDKWRTLFLESLETAEHVTDIAEHRAKAAS